MLNARTAFRAYAVRGWSGIPVYPRSKRPIGNGWDQLRLGSNDADRIDPAGNIGIILGVASSNLHDVDLDSGETVRLASRYLPDTDSIFDRPSKPDSHRLYFVEPALDRHAFKDPITDEMQVEIRGNGCQTIFPPSVHPSGERIRWERDGQPTRLPAQALLDAVRRLYAAAMLERRRSGASASKATRQAMELWRTSTPLWADGAAAGRFSMTARELHKPWPDTLAFAEIDGKPCIVAALQDPELRLVRGVHVTPLGGEGYTVGDIEGLRAELTHAFPLERLVLAETVE